uniref:Reverse transcriptase domain-containing protein n=1 Tax=Xenopus tropicalis TaxID=8364 RepID=A0A803K3V4_XENTR
MSFINKVLKKARQETGTKLLIMGDFNLAPDPLIDKSPIPKGNTLRSATSLSKSFFNTIKQYELYDVWRAGHPTERDYTFLSHVHMSYSRIDLVLADKSTLFQSVKPYIGIATWSDHAPVGCFLDFLQIPTPSSTWRLNNTLLLNKQHEEKITKLTTEFFALNSTPDISKDLLWCTYKAYIRGQLIAMAASETKKKKAKAKDLLVQLAEASRQHKIHPTEALAQKVSSLNAEINVINMERVTFQIMLTKQRYYVEDNKNSRLLASKLRDARVNNRILSIKTSDGQMLSNPKHIAQEFANYYTKLYNLKDDPTTPQPDSTNITNFLTKISLPSLSENQLEYFNAPITQAEVTSTIKALKNNKAPGPDGFSNNFYKNLSASLAPKLTELFNFLPTSQSPRKELFQATITTIPKPNKDPTRVENYRPISLLNSDIKIYAKILANRLNPILKSLISDDQVGFVPTRQAPDNTRKVINIAIQANQTRSPCLLVALDAEKAFDRVSWLYLQKVLEKFGFSGTFLDHILTLYKSPSAAIQTNGQISPRFSLTNGTRQGCPLSPLIFVLLMEPLAEAIRQQSQISGFLIGKNSYKLSLFADDIILTLSNPICSLQTLFQLLSEFSEISYYKINTTKTEALPIWIPKNQVRELKASYKFLWQQSVISYLGIKVGFSVTSLYNANFKAMLGKIEQYFQSWTYKEISWIGRLSAIKTMILPKILYLFRTIPIKIPNKYFTALQKSISKYIWKAKKPRIPLASLSKGKLQGGLGFPNFKKYYQASHLNFIQRIFTTTTQPQWVRQEKDITISSLLHLDELIWIPPKLRLKSIKSFPTFHASITVWDSVIHSDHLSLGLHPKFPLSAFKGIIPNFNPAPWLQAGIDLWANILINNQLPTFQILRTKWPLPSKSFYIYLQLSSFRKANPYCKPKQLSATQQKITSLSMAGARISHFYAAINDQSSKPPGTHISAWEKELNLSIDPIDWNTAFTLIMASTKSARLLEPSIKLMYRWYLVPSRLHKIFPQTASKECWRGCGQDGTHVHIWWECPKLASFWTQVFDLINKVLECPVHKTPLTALLNLDLDFLKYSQKRLVVHFLEVARLLIAQRWKTDLPPAISELVNFLDLTERFEFFDARNRNSLGNHHKKWSPWKHFNKG